MIFWKNAKNHKLNFPFYIARRYLLSSSKNNAINIITGIASVGIIVGTLSLFVVLSVFSGLKEFSLSFSNDFDPDLKVSTSVGKSFKIDASQTEKIKKITGIAATSQVVEERVLFMYDNKEHVAYLKGVDSTFQYVNDVNKSLFTGQWLEPDTFQAVIGYTISQKLTLGIFDNYNPLEVFVPKAGKGTIENPDDAFVKENLLPAGIYDINDDINGKYVFADLGLVQELLQYKKNEFTGLEVKLKSAKDEEIVTSQLSEILGSGIIIKNRAAQNDALYKMLNTENLAVYLIFTLVLIVALFNLIGALIMMILDKKQNLHTLLNLGAEIKNLRMIFLFQGSLLCVAGGLIGLALGAIIVLLQQKFELIMITSTLAYPVVFSLENMLIVFATIIVLGFVASLIASSRVSKRLLEQ